ncbi:hypothetical protein [Massilia sp. 9096]|uniref:hypothetical protein n=1 Tax=Massilia sp. 9096 TaxID=1500894 RepID=UPI0012E00379|nr:hypothetical protein [Massilia sp. 9096]
MEDDISRFVLMRARVPGAGWPTDIPRIDTRGQVALNAEPARAALICIKDSIPFPLV